MQFAEQFPDFWIVSPLTTQLSWTHVVEVPALKTPAARLFYLGEAATRQLGKRELRRMIDRKTFERKEIANAQLGVRIRERRGSLKRPDHRDPSSVSSSVSSSVRVRDIEHEHRYDKLPIRVAWVMKHEAVSRLVRPGYRSL